MNTPYHLAITAYFVIVSLGFRNISTVVSCLQTSFKSLMTKSYDNPYNFIFDYLISLPLKKNISSLEVKATFKQLPWNIGCVGYLLNRCRASRFDKNIPPISCTSSFVPPSLSKYTQCFRIININRIFVDIYF